MFEKINNFFSSKKNSNLIKEISNKYLNKVNQLEGNISNLSKEEMGLKIETLKQRLKKDRPMKTITLRIPEDVVKDLERIAPILGFSGYQPLMRTYIGQGLREDLEKLENSPFWELIESLKRHGVEEDIINNALEEITYNSDNS